MNKEEILTKSRAENKNKDIYEQEVLKKASNNAVNGVNLRGWLFFIAVFPTISVYLYKSS